MKTQLLTEVLSRGMQKMNCDYKESCVNRDSNLCEVCKYLRNRNGYYEPDGIDIPPQMMPDGPIHDINDLWK